MPFTQLVHPTFLDELLASKLAMLDSKTIGIDKVRGDRKPLRKMVGMVRDSIDIEKPMHFVVHYDGCIEQGEELKDMIASRFRCTELDLIPPSLGMACATTGPVAGLPFYS